MYITKIKQVKCTYISTNTNIKIRINFASLVMPISLMLKELFVRCNKKKP